MADLQALSEALIKGDRATVVRLTEQALSEGLPPAEVLNKGLITGMDEVGRRFKVNEIYVPEVLIAARAMKGGLEVLEPRLKTAGVKPVGTVVLGTVRKDMHDIGKNLVSMMLTGGGLKVVDVGIDAAPEKFVDACKANHAQICAIERPADRDDAGDGHGDRAHPRGRGQGQDHDRGRPVTQEYADEIGANGYAADAASAVDLARRLL